MRNSKLAKMNKSRVEYLAMQSAFRSTCRTTGNYQNRETVESRWQAFRLSVQPKIDDYNRATNHNRLGELTYGKALLPDEQEAVIVPKAAGGWTWGKVASTCGVRGGKYYFPHSMGTMDNTNLAAENEPLGEVLTKSIGHETAIEGDNAGKQVLELEEV